MSALLDSYTAGGYGGDSIAPSSGGVAAGSSSSFYDKLGDVVANGLNRWVDVETWRNTQGQMPPNYYNGGKVQAINTGTQVHTVAGIPTWVLLAGAVVAGIVLLKK